MQERYHALDSMRATMMLLGIYLHVVVGYSGNGHWPYIDAHPTPVLDWSLGLIHAFRMPAFFAMAGFFGALLWERRGPASFAANRGKRIVVPFFLFWVLLFPVMVAIMVSLERGPEHVAGVFRSGRFLRRLHPLHLWFLEYLILLYAIGAAAASLPRWDRLHRAFRWALQKPYAPAIFAVFSWIPLGIMRGNLKDCEGFRPDLLILSAYIGPFAFGWILYAHRDLLPRFQKHVWTYLVFAFFAFLLYGLTSDRTHPFVKAAGNVLLCWLLTFAVLGLFLRYANRQSPRWRYLSDSSYWLFIMHMPVVVGFQVALRDVPLPALAKVPIVLALSVAVLLASYRLGVRPTWIGAMLNGRRYAAAAAAMLLLAVGIARGQSYTFTEFDIPGAPNAAPTGINNRGQIVLTASDSPGVSRAFLRAADGTIVELEVPGARSGTTAANAINHAGQIAGTYRDGNTILCYIRSAAGEYVRFAGPEFFVPTSINDAGALTGPGRDVVHGGQGHVRGVDGLFAAIRAPFLGGTAAQAIDTRGEIAGWGIFGGSTSAQHGFFRRTDGSYTRFDLPGTTSYSRIMALNNSGQFAGFVVTSFLGFVGQPDGSFSLLPEHPVSAINDLGEIVGRRLGAPPEPWRPYLGRPAAAPPEPQIRTEFAGVLTASAFGGAPSIAPGTWIEIYGRNLSGTTRGWREADFSGATAPTSLDGVSVSIGGARAFVSYVSPGQVNALVPAEVPPGAAQVTVTNGSRTGAPYPLTVVDSQPGILAFPADPSPFHSWVAALFPGFSTYAAPPWYAAPARRPKPGETIVLFAVGLGPVAPDVPVGRIAPGPSRLTTAVEVFFSRNGAVSAPVTYAGLVPGTVGLYQINVTVPDVLYPDLPMDVYVILDVTVAGKPTMREARRGLYVPMEK